MDTGHRLRALLEHMPAASVRIVSSLAPSTLGSFHPPIAVAKAVASTSRTGFRWRNMLSRCCYIYSNSKLTKREVSNKGLSFGQNFGSNKGQNFSFGQNFSYLKIRSSTQVLGSLILVRKITMVRREEREPSKLTSTVNLPSCNKGLSFGQNFSYLKI